MKTDTKTEDLKFYASACSSGHGNWLQPLGFKATENIEEANVVVFGGGADIEPSTYKEEAASGTYTSPSREAQERADFEVARKLGIKCVGICRGLQLLCAMAGGKLIQDVTSHGGDHYITTFDKAEYRTNSIHHQMINPYTLKPSQYKILAWTTKRISRHYFGAKDKPVNLPWDFKEIEAAYFPRIDSFGVQYHPEMMFRSSYHAPVVEWTQNTFMKFFNNEL